MKNEAQGHPLAAILGMLAGMQEPPTPLQRAQHELEDVQKALNALPSDEDMAKPFAEEDNPECVGLFRFVYTGEDHRLEVDIEPQDRLEMAKRMRVALTKRLELKREALAAAEVAAAAEEAKTETAQ